MGEHNLSYLLTYLPVPRSWRRHWYTVGCRCWCSLCLGLVRISGSSVLLLSYSLHSEPVVPWHSKNATHTDKSLLCQGQMDQRHRGIFSWFPEWDQYVIRCREVENIKLDQWSWKGERTVDLFCRLHYTTLVTFCSSALYKFSSYMYTVSGKKEARVFSP